jgi:transcriptional regulator
MYTPKLYREEDRSRILEFLQQNDFATVVAHDGKKPIASHLLVDVIEENGRWLVNSHMSRANPLWKAFTKDTEVLIVFQGPHTYISPTWYNHINVPTWNYQAVHVYGTPRLVTDRAEAYQLLKRLTDRYENTVRYKMETLPQDFVEKELRGIMAFQLDVTHIEANYKLSQNRDDEDYWNIVSHLEARQDEHSQDVAEAMRRQRPHPDE